MQECLQELAMIIMAVSWLSTEFEMRVAARLLAAECTPAFRRAILKLLNAESAYPFDFLAFLRPDPATLTLVEFA